MTKTEITTKAPILLFVVLLLLTLAFGVKQRSSITSDEVNKRENTTEIEKSDDGKNGVTFSAALLSSENNLTFKVTVDTHSGDLSEVDFKRDIVLEKDGKTYFAYKTDIEGEGHHLEAEMSFPKVIPPFTLVAENIREVQRRELVF